MARAVDERDLERVSNIMFRFKMSKVTLSDYEKRQVELWQGLCQKAQAIIDDNPDLWKNVSHEVTWIDKCPHCGHVKTVKPKLQNDIPSPHP